MPQPTKDPQDTFVWSENPARTERGLSGNKTPKETSEQNCDAVKARTDIAAGEMALCVLKGRHSLTDGDPTIQAQLPRPDEIPDWCANADWDYNRVLSCRNGIETFALIQDGKIIGTADVETWDLVRTNHNNNKFSWDQWANVASTAGQFRDLWAGLTYQGVGMCTGQCALETVNVGPRLVPSSTWLRTYHIWHSTISTIGGRNKPSLDVEMTWILPGTIPMNTTYNRSLDRDIRCDYRSPGTNAYYGCIFPEFRPTLRVPRSILPEYADHIADAQATNWPVGMPGGLPLTRLTNQDDIDENRTMSCANQPSPRPSGQQCDEYPFASTYQGSYTSGFDASSRLINEQQNHDGGQQLQEFYQLYRILDKEAFHVQVVTI
ncbi:NucA/NucB deoxyribonuclease domain-containing protein [Nonomuraea sp. NPDC047529]|uniref:NucA/NucB deoxyribonuclease domain-containing protein n=1 Tax=Nonomuraea sp. NPDC047529 TaxID=3155623 RepID=UPI0033CAF8AC